MAKATTLLKQGDVQGLMKAARRAGFSQCIVRQHPDGVIEAIASDGDASLETHGENSMDLLLKGKAN